MELALRVPVTAHYANVLQDLEVQTALCNVLKATQEQIVQACLTAGYMDIVTDTAFV